MRTPLPRLVTALYRVTSSKFRRAEATLHGFVQGKVEAGRDRVRAGGAELCLLDNILKKELEDGGVQTLAWPELRDELLTLLLAVRSFPSSQEAWLILFRRGKRRRHRPCAG